MLQGQLGTPRIALDPKAMSLGAGYGNFPGGYSLMLDFEQNQVFMAGRGLVPLTDAVDFTGGANGYVTNSAGILVPSAAPRLDYNPITRAFLGLLVEEARTNLAIRSAEFDNVSWVKLGTATVTPNTNIAPDGTLSADTLNMPASGDRISLTPIGVTGGSTVTATLWLSGSGTTYIALSSSGGTYKFSGTQVTLTATLTRYQVTLVTNADNTAVFPVIGRYDGSVGAGTATAAVIWGYQFEVGSFPTSYIPTTSASVTRSADSAVMTGTNFSSWYNQAQGTFVLSADQLSVAATTQWASPNDGTSLERLRMGVSAAAAFYGEPTDGGVGQGFITDSTAIVGTPGNLAFAYKLDDFALCVNGRTPVTDATGTLPTVTQLTIGVGAAAAQPINGHVRSVRYYPQRLPNATLQALTA